MKIFLYQDDSLDLNMHGLISGLNTPKNKDIGILEGKSKFRIVGGAIRYDESYAQLPQSLKREVKDADLSLCFTKVPYDNNYFFHGQDNLVIVSFYAWEQLTSLPLENGAVYFLASLLRFRLPLPLAHQGVTGCINDFLWDKSGIDPGMRSGFLCDDCIRHLNKQKLTPKKTRLLGMLMQLLEDLGTASRSDENIIDYWKRLKEVRATESNEKFDVFLCHNSQDKSEVRAVARELQALNIRTWFDEEQLRPGLAWQVVLEEQIAAIGSAAVFVGRSGIGPWQGVELRAFLSEFVNRRCPVIPVILAGAKTVPELPIFLRQLTWVDFRQNPDDAMARLIWGITGDRPERPTKRTVASLRRRIVQSN